MDRQAANDSAELDPLPSRRSSVAAARPAATYTYTKIVIPSGIQL